MAKIFNIILIIILIVESILFYLYIKNHDFTITINHKVEIDEKTKEIIEEIEIPEISIPEEISLTINNDDIDSLTKFIEKYDEIPRP